MKISQVKFDIKTVLTNLEQLQVHRDNLTQGILCGELPNIEKCKQNIEESFTRLAKISFQKVVGKLKQRKVKRSIRTKRLKHRKIRQKSSTNNPYTLPNDGGILPQETLTALNRRKLRCAEEYLRIIQSLVDLHRLRGGGNDCSLQDSLKPLQSIWQSTILTIKSEEKNTCSVETQWDNVLFGGKSEIQTKGSLKGLIERRCIWDSYLVPEDDHAGSYIPIGWVVPKENTRTEWQQFRS